MAKRKITKSDVDTVYEMAAKALRTQRKSVGLRGTAR